MDLVIDRSGHVRTIYAELLDLSPLGKVSISRASHVEPNSQGSWYADLSPLGGPPLGPFPCRSLALAAETEWLSRHWLLRPC